jgi:hypothetical protein
MGSVRLLLLLLMMMAHCLAVSESAHRWHDLAAAVAAGSAAAAPAVA